MESKSDDPPVAASVAAASASTTADDATIAQCWQAVKSLTSIFGFPFEVANHAVNVVGPDVTACYNLILDQQLAKDGGGAIEPVDTCPHIAQHVQTSVKQIQDVCQNTNMMEIPCCIPPNQKMPTGGLKSEPVLEDDDHCPLGENWICLATQKILCSRYVNGHALQHWKDTGHCIAVSLADLSVWCHVCEAYVKDKQDDGDLVLKPILQALEYIKFGGEQSEGADKA